MRIKSPRMFIHCVVKTSLTRNAAVAVIGTLALLAVVRTVASSTFSSAVPSAPAGQENAEDRQVIVTVLSWYSPVGELNGSRLWSQFGYAYEDSKASNGVKNYPLTEISLPKLAPSVGSHMFYQLQYQAAQADLRQMRLAGFDVAAFDMLPMPAFDPAKPLDPFNVPFTHYQTFLRWLKAGEDEGMKVALFADIKNKSADYPAGRTLNVQEWVNTLSGALDGIGQAPALWRIDGRPVVFHFGTDASAGAPPLEGAEKPDGGWRQVLKTLRDSGHSFYFIADVRPSLFVRSQQWSRIADAVYMFSPASPASFMVEKQAEMSPSFTVPFIWSVSPGYFNSAVNAYTEPDFRRIHDTYLAAMKAGARYMNVLTWNDFGEDTDIAPSANKGRGLLEVFSFYNQWFKSGAQPKAVVDKIVVAYPMRIPTAVRTKSPVYGIGKWVSPPYAPKVFYWANIKSGRTLEVAGVGKHDLPSGLSMGVLGMASPGTIHAILGEQSIPLPAIQQTSVESQRAGSGGLEYRYVMLQ